MKSEIIIHSETDLKSKIYTIKVENFDLEHRARQQCQISSLRLYRAGNLHADVGIFGFGKASSGLGVCLFFICHSVIKTGTYLFQSFLI